VTFRSDNDGMFNTINQPYNTIDIDTGHEIKNDTKDHMKILVDLIPKDYFPEKSSEYLMQKSMDNSSNKKENKSQ